MEGDSINYSFIKRMTENWPKRAGVRNFKNTQHDNSYDENTPDYPINMLPFYKHPLFVKIPDKEKQKILTWAWIFYNERVIIAEERIANPAFLMILTDKFPGINKFHMKQALQQCLIDEHFHILMHMTAINETKKLRSISMPLNSPYSIIYRRLIEEQKKVTDRWKKDLLLLVWTIVSEISINAYLNLLSTNKDIQPMHKYITWIHNRDEFSHSKIMIEIGKWIFNSLNIKQKNFFILALDKSLSAFTEYDFSLWTFILKQTKIHNYFEIIKDCEKNLNYTQLARDFSLLKKFTQDLNIVNKLEFCGLN